MEYDIRRSSVFAPRGVVATSQQLAAGAGLAALRRGGNAVDAAIAAAVALTVVQPGSNDIGGDLFALVWDGERLHGLNASGRSPRLLTRELVLERSPGAMPDRGWLCVTVPGAPRGWRDLHARFGSLPFAELFADAIVYAERGYPVSPRTAAGWRVAAEQVYPGLAGAEFAEWERVFTFGGRAPRAGERWANPGAARTLRRIAGTDSDDMYSGETAAAIVAHAERTGGLLRADDLAGHASEWVEPISVRYRGHEVWELPPNGQGIAALIALGVLDGYEMSSLHQQIEAMKLGFADAHAFVADPEVGGPVRELLEPGYLRQRRALIGERAGRYGAGEPQRGGTVYLCTADAAGRMVSLIQSNYMGFGSFVVPPGTGLGLQDRGAGFVLAEDHPNVVGPGKRPFHTIIPAFLTRGGEPVGPFGVMGGHMQPQGHVQVVLSTVDARLDPQAALDRPRWYWGRGLEVQVEPGLAGSVDELRRRGHAVSVAASPEVFGMGQAIWRTTHGYVAGSEPRADGYAAGY
ncbi:gamma-glutamyltransferase family protein [Dactylosporangium matsuzakiense]|uniref:Gamma-glutamyltranspeptidase n=1 Tax=Dactylosporangium matsuzakiense TaxID=53360 RepID=A0A9W6KLM9_9ACTN|nr:gamma-glutamyltranspeptidase [Dactylosporangium matsuzakiense]